MAPEALRYAEHWEPVLAAAAGRLLERVAARAGDPAPTSVLDVGTGTGLLALSAARRWPAARIVGVDASAAMLSLARQRAEELASSRPVGTIEWHAADAAALPLPEASVDVVLSSFMLQLVERRSDALREMRRVLRPGGWLGLVGWLTDDDGLEPDHEFDEAVLDLELKEPDADEPPVADGAWADLTAARDDVAAAGFADVEARDDRLEHAWSRAGYREFKQRFDEQELFDSLGPADRERLLARVDERWATLPASAFVLRAPLVVAIARRPREAAAGRLRQAAKGVDSSGRQTRQGR